MVAGAGAVALRAQIEGGDRGIIPADSANLFEVDDIRVDVVAKTAEAARLGGWRLAQREGWKKLWAKLHPGGGAAPQLADGALDAIVSGISVESEEIGPARYVARLGVVFDRARAGKLIGDTGHATRSAPVLVIPVLWSGGTPTSFEIRNPWQRAWAQFRGAGSTIDYVRPVGNGPDPLLLNVGQSQRPDRLWWRTLLDIYGAADVVVPTVRLDYSAPGGAVMGRFEAIHGPDGQFLGGFTLRASSVEGLPAMLAEGVRQLDAIYAGALARGAFATDPSLTIEPVLPMEVEEAPVVAIEPQTLLIEVDTPDQAALTQAEAMLRAIPAMRSVRVAGLAVGGASLFNAVYGGSENQFIAALDAQGYRAERQSGGWKLRRAAPATPTPPPVVAPTPEAPKPALTEEEQRDLEKAARKAEKKRLKEERRAREEAEKAARRAAREAERRANDQQ